MFSYPPFLDACRYWTTVTKYREYFEDENIKVVLFENLISDYQATLKDVFTFLGVAEEVAINPDHGKQNKSAGKAVYSPWGDRFGRFLSPSIKAMLPHGWKQNLKAMVNGLSSPQIDHTDLSNDEVSDVRSALGPEIRELYSYLDIKDDPWNFFTRDEPAALTAKYGARPRS